MNRLPDDYFTDMYAQDPDPWRFDERWYEHRKRALTVAMLPRRRFRNAFEPGCSTGALTEMLALRCDELLATDVVDDVLDTARARLDGVPGVTFLNWALGDPWPADMFDLIVLSEVGYYVKPEAFDDVVEDVAHHLGPDAVVLAAHWRHPVSDYPTTGDEVHDALARNPGLIRTARYEDADVLIETFASAAVPPDSVARREGLVD
ncbi:SAM-dependent methyltransferase [Rhodococcus sp. SGAir0479]|uniref:SAM-dependent methyltransferase n=1 Tax=Rhodococcus sp. SGAir0479 TaxID=2567884 RepID=UPI0010CD5DEC|nr:SAM-dependent methyltransferase [Rhodococcus sp. SGAir0479]QCQ90955.1 methyltransferase domain-containing protein [Rhodococcus sp. SGAir0479]